MDAFVFGTPAHMIPQKPILCIFGGLYHFMIEGVNMTGGGGFVTATIRPNDRVKVIPEKLDEIPSILDIFEFCEETTFVEFLLSIVVNGTIDPDYIVKQVHIRDDKGMIMIQARIIPGPSIQAPIDPTTSYKQQSFTQRLGKSEFFITGQEYDLPSQPVAMAVIDVLHNDLVTNDRWGGFTSPAVDWSVVYREMIHPLEKSAMGGYLGGMFTPNIGKQYMEFNTIFSVAMSYNQMDPTALLFEIPDDDTDPFEAWRQTYATVFPGFLPIILKTGGKMMINGDTYMYTSMVVEGKIQNGWATHFIQTNRPNVMYYYPEAGISNVVDMSIRLKENLPLHFEAAFFPFMEDSKNLAIPYSGDANYPYIIGVLECEFTEVIEDPRLLAHIIPNPAGTFLAEPFCKELNEWFGLGKNEPWMLVNIVSKPSQRNYFVLTKNHPKGLFIKQPDLPEASKPDDNAISAEKSKRRWGFFGKV
ncbi:MAG: hypothetical protein NC548_06245 [Lachnospiraceae bacterium]|nr:hypothetical protein [Lachnospiraceae bacterium]